MTNLPNLVKAKRVLSHRRPVYDPLADQLGESRKSNRWRKHDRATREAVRLSRQEATWSVQ